MNTRRLPTGFKRMVALAAAVALTLGAIAALASGAGRNTAEAQTTRQPEQSSSVD